jgi:DNA-directed RNA polymerase specialized sigma24 family protein
MIALAGAGRCDPLLIEAARGGDVDALVSLIAIAQPDIRRYAARNCRAADIDDAVQETLLLLYRRIGTLRAMTSFSAWLFAVARRACLRLLRREWRTLRPTMRKCVWRILGPKTFASTFPAPSSRCPITTVR